MPVIHLENLTRRYGKRRGIHQVSFTVNPGELFGFLGPNGAGKTTTIRVLLGLLRPSAGSARIFGLDCWRDTKKIKGEVGYLPGDLRLAPWMNGESALSVFGAVRHRDLLAPGRRLAERLDLDLQVKVRAMSRGTRQKLGLLLALAHAPRLLILDEPTAALDPLIQQVLQDVLREFAQAGHTIFFSSHSLPEVEQLCHRVAIIRNGELVADEPLATLRARAGHEVRIRWGSSAEANALQPPPCFRIIHRQDCHWQGVLEGPVQLLLDFLAGKQIEELSIGRPDLETLFRRFYQSAPGIEQ